MDTLDTEEIVDHNRKFTVWLWIHLWMHAVICSMAYLEEIQLHKDHFGTDFNLKYLIYGCNFHYESANYFLY